MSVERAFCMECGARLTAEDRFCDECGTAQPVPEHVAEMAAAATEPVAPQPAVAMPEPEPEPEPAPLLWASPAPAPEAPPVVTVTEIQHCLACGRHLTPGAPFCGHCGTRRRVAAAEPVASLVAAVAATVAAAPVAPASVAPAPAAPPAAPPAPPAPPAPAPWQGALPAPFDRVPVSVLVVCALEALAGLLCLYVLIRPLPDILEGLAAGGLAFQITLFFFAFMFMIGLFGAALLLVSWRLAHADRVARGLTYVLLGGTGAAILVGDDKSTTLVLVMLSCFAGVAVLALSPAVEAFLRGGGAPQGGQPTGVVTARTLVAAWAACCALVGVMLLPLGGLGGKFVVVGLFLVGLAAAAFHLNRLLAERNSTAQVIVTLGCAVYFALTLVIGDRSPGAVLPLVLTVGIVWNLWGPESSRRYYGW